MVFDDTCMVNKIWEIVRKFCSLLNSISLFNFATGNFITNKDIKQNLYRYNSSSSKILLHIICLGTRTQVD